MRKLTPEEQNRLNTAIEMAKRIEAEMKEEPKGIHYLGLRRRATRASEYIANQPLAQEIISKYLGIPK